MYDICIITNVELREKWMQRNKLNRGLYSFKNSISRKLFVYNNDDTQASQALLSKSSLSENGTL